jgi:hypothetical protein
MKALKWMSLALICGVVGCAAEGNENAETPALDGEANAVEANAVESPIAEEKDAVGAEALVENDAEIAVLGEDETDIVDDDFPWESLWSSGASTKSASTQACATSTTTSTESTTAKRCCVPTSWAPTGRTAVTEKESGTYWNSRDSLGAGQQIRFKALSGRQYSRLTTSCTTEYAWVYHSAEYRLRNCSSGDSGWTTCTGWTSWKDYTSRLLGLCGSHASPPPGSSYWGCAFGSKKWVRWL